jgi:glycosyltransferase involved in cell wall biosynthesis
VISVVANLCFVVPGVVGGSEQHSVGLLRAARDHCGDRCDVSVVGSKALFAAYPDLVSRTAGVLDGPAAFRPYRIAAESLWLPSQTRSAQLTHHFGGRLPVRSQQPSVVTIHDLQPLEHAENFSRTKAAYLARALPRSAQRARLVFTPSRWVAERIVDRLGVSPERLRVVGPAVSVAVNPDDPWDRLDRLGERRLIVFPAISHLHKNHRVLIEAMAEVTRHHPDALLVLTGGVGQGEQDMRTAMAEVDPDGRFVQHWGRIRTTRLHSLVARAELLAFPSRYEGFGIPTVEAMALGTAVVASTATCLPEIVGDAGQLVGSDTAQAWAEALVALLGDDQQRAGMVERGQVRARRWSPPQAAAVLVDAWQDAIGDEER